MVPRHARPTAGLPPKPAGPSSVTLFFSYLLLIKGKYFLSQGGVKDMEGKRKVFLNQTLSLGQLQSGAFDSLDRCRLREAGGRLTTWASCLSRTSTGALGVVLLSVRAGSSVLVTRERRPRISLS